MIGSDRIGLGVDFTPSYPILSSPGSSSRSSYTGQVRGGKPIQGKCSTSSTLIRNAISIFETYRTDERMGMVLLNFTLSSGWG